MCANTTIGVLAERPRRSQPLELILPQVAETVRLEIQHVDETDEMHAMVIEAVITSILRGLAVAIEILGYRGIGDIMLTRRRMQLGHFEL